MSSLCELMVFSVFLSKVFFFGNPKLCYKKYYIVSHTKRKKDEHVYFISVPLCKLVQLQAIKVRTSRRGCCPGAAKFLSMNVVKI